MQSRSTVWLLLIATVLLVGTAGAATDDRRILETVSVGDIPVLISTPVSISTKTRLVVLFHGFAPPENPERLAEAMPLDGTPFIGAYVNMPMVARRLPPGGADELRRVQQDDFVNGLYFRSIAGAAEELSSVVSYVEKKYHVQTERGIGVFGFSAGGSAALLALTESKVSIASIVVVNAPLSVRQDVGVWERELQRTFVWDEKSEGAAKRFDVLTHVRAIAERKPRPAILIMQGDKDEHLAVQPALDVAAKLNVAYGQDESMVQMRILSGISHNFGLAAKQDRGLNISDGKQIRDGALAWFARWLGA
jgi:dienelactone hydrolase